MKIDSLYLTTPKHSGGEDKLAVQVQTPKHSGGEDKLAVQVQTPKHSGGADNPGSGRCSKPVSAESPARAENTVQSAPFRNTEQRPGKNSLGTWKTDTESKTPQEQ